MQLDLVCNIFCKIPIIHSFILFIVLIRSGWWPQDLIIKSDKKRWESVVWCNRHRHHMAPWPCGPGHQVQPMHNHIVYYITHSNWERFHQSLGTKPGLGYNISGGIVWSISRSIGYIMRNVILRHRIEKLNFFTDHW